MKSPPSHAHRQLLELEYIYDAAPVALVLVDRDLRYVRVNARLAKLNGISVEEHIGRRIEEVVPEKAGLLVPLYRSVLETGEAVSGLELTLPLKGGGTALFVVSYYPLRSPQGEVTGVCGVIRDVTAERMAESELRESEARYRFLTDSLPQFVWTLDDAGIAEYCNPYMLRYLGCSLQQMRAGEWRRAIHPEDLPDALRTLAAGIRGGRPFELEMRVRRASDGEYLWHLFRARPFTHNRGDPMWLATAIDIDGRKKAGQAHALLASIVESSSEAIIGLDRHGAITSWNRAAENLFGYAAREAIGQPISFLSPPGSEHSSPLLARVLAGERCERHEII
ncbi:MAG: PAS domain S-box protein, partial [Acidobacteriota bacterium]|nr:PAS domain S-box protein [Acidobacteriota bacterium]